jgi:hypothetical protein
MALASQGTKRYVLGGTLVNALVHHQRAATADEALRHVSALLNGTDEDGTSADWVQAHIDRISNTLGD